MPLQCNIDAKGKLLRFAYGTILVVIGILMTIFWAMPSESILAWTIAVACVLGGAFALFEARKGWCVIRAMGFKTPL